MGDIYAQVIGVSTAQLAERDAEITKLRALVADLEMDVEKLSAADAEADITIAQLQAWKDAIPLDALRYIFYDCDIDNAEGADVVVMKWLDGMAEE